MPRRELKSGRQVVEWLDALSRRLQRPGQLILIGSAALLWHAEQRGIATELPEASMDVDALTDSDEIADACYDCLIGSEFERSHGWHVNLMPNAVLRELPSDWRTRAASAPVGLLTVVVPQPADLLEPKLRRGEPRDQRHYDWAARIGLVPSEPQRDQTEVTEP
jgi:hypothetical protein